MSLETLDKALSGTVDLSVGDIIARYPSKEEIIAAFQRGEIADQAKAVMAGMAIDRIAANAIKLPETTVAQDVFAPQPQAGIGAMAPGMGQPGMDQGMGQDMAMGKPPMPTQMMAAGGLARIPVRENMFDYAGGGIVAFQGGGMPMQTRLRLREMMNPQEQAMFDRSGTVPERLQPVASELEQQGLRAPVGMQDGRPVPLDVGTGQELGAPQALPSTPEMAVDAMPSLANIDVNPFVSQARDIASAIRPAAAPKVPTVQEASKTTSDLLKESGFDETVLTQIRNDIKEQRESMAADKKESQNLRLIEMGLGILGGESPYGFVNIGKGAAPALKGLASDIQEHRKAERELRAAEQNLLLKQNEVAMGKAKITQATIDKAQDRLDRSQESFDRTTADLTKTLLSGEMQRRIAKETIGSRMTDFDKQWRQYEIEATRKGETPSWEGFRRSLEGSRGELTFKDAMAIAQKDAGLSLQEARTAAFSLMEDDKRLRGGATATSSENNQALAWANANPNDPRAKQIKEYLGVK